MLTLRPYQRAAIDQTYHYLRNYPGNPVINLPTGCHAKGQKILMLDGKLKNVEDIIVGDFLMGPDSKPRKVLNLHRGTDNMFKINPIKGDHFIVNGGHILSLVTTNEGKKWNCTTKGNEIENISVYDYIHKSKSWKHLRKLYRASVDFRKIEKNIDFFGNEMDLPPRFMGMMLGDGHIKQALTFTTMDSVLGDYIEKIAKQFHCGVRIEYKDNNKAWGIIISKRNAIKDKKPSLIMSIFESYGLRGKLSDTKIIPHKYKVASREDRLELLAGLIDTDGSLSRSGYDYITKSEILANDIAFVARSVGLACYIKKTMKKCQNGFSGEYFRLSISGDCSIVPVLLDRKKSNSRIQKKRHNVTGLSIEHVGIGEYYGFEVDEDNLYLLDDFTVTHNSGKSVVIAALCQEALQNWPGTKILKITGRKELIQQNYDKLRLIWPNAPVGIYSASLNKRDIEPITFAGIQSIRNRALELGHRDLIIIDEAHEISHEETGTYRKVIAELTAINPALRVIGLTATPYRLGHGMITEKPAIFDALIEPTSILILQEQGYLAKVRSKHTKLNIDTSQVHKRGWEYIETELQKAVDDNLLNEEAVAETIRRAEDRRAWLLFCSGVEHSYHIRDALRAQGVAAETVTGDTPEAERDAILRDFKAGKIRAVTNANILTTGFDYPDIDLIVMLRPTCSAGLYMQMVGRGLRMKGNGGDCLVLDFAGNVAMHGPIIAVRPPEKVAKGDGIAPSKICPECEEMVAMQAKVCPCCGYAFTNDKEKTWKLHDDDISGQDMVKEMEVSSWFWSTQISKSGKEMIVCRYYGQLYEKPIPEYFCVFHDGFAGNKARKLFMEVSLKAGLKTQPERTEELENARPPDKIRYIKDGKFFRVIDRVWSSESFDDAIPF